MPNAGVWDELEHAGQHAEPGAQHRSDDDIDGESPARRRTQRSLHLTVLGRNISQGLGSQQDADAIGQRAKSLRIRVCAAQAGEALMNKRMVNQVQHSRELTTPSAYARVARYGATSPEPAQ